MTAAVDSLRARLALYASLTVVGIALSVMSDGTLGGVVTLGSLTLLVWTLHRYGRTGPS